MKRYDVITRLGGAALLAFAMLMCANMTAAAAPLRIVAIGASNTHGFYVGNEGAYPRSCRPSSEPRASMLRWSMPECPSKRRG